LALAALSLDLLLSVICMDLPVHCPVAAPSYRGLLLGSTPSTRLARWLVADLLSLDLPIEAWGQWLTIRLVHWLPVVLRSMDLLTGTAYLVHLACWSRLALR
jgi:hypothetical protein